MSKVLTFAAIASLAISAFPQTGEQSIAERLTAIEAAFNATAEGRRNLHGGNPSSTFETNAETRIIQRVDTYPDGYRHIEQGKVKTRTMEQKASLLVNQKNAAAQKAGLLKSMRSRVESLEKDIAEYESNPTKEGRTAYAKAVIELAKAQKSLERMEVGTPKTIDVVIKPSEKK